jgi:hypothetical protein
MLRKLFTLLTALVAFAMTPLWAQSPQSFDWTASVTITPFLSWTVTSNLAYGAHFATEGSLRSGMSNHAELACTTDPGNSFSASFVLPSTLARVGGGGSVPITYEAESARLYDGGANELVFNPSTGTTGFISASGILNLQLGHGLRSGSQDAVVVNLAGAPSGSYSGVITVTLSIL